MAMNKPKGMKKPRAKKGTFKRLIKNLFSFYPRAIPVVLLLIIFNAAVTSMP